MHMRDLVSTKGELCVWSGPLKPSQKTHRPDRPVHVYVYGAFFLQYGLVAGCRGKPAPNKSRCAEAFRAPWVPRCIWSRPQAEIVVKRIWPVFLSLVRAEVHVCFVPDRYPGVFGRGRRPRAQSQKFFRCRDLASLKGEMCVFGWGPSDHQGRRGEGGIWGEVQGCRTFTSGVCAGISSQAPAKF